MALELSWINIFLYLYVRKGLKRMYGFKSFLTGKVDIKYTFKISTVYFISTIQVFFDRKSGYKIYSRNFEFFEKVVKLLDVGFQKHFGWEDFKTKSDNLGEVIEKKWIQWFPKSQHYIQHFCYTHKQKKDFWFTTVKLCVLH